MATFSGEIKVMFEVFLERWSYSATEGTEKKEVLKDIVEAHEARGGGAIANPSAQLGQFVKLIAPVNGFDKKLATYPVVRRDTSAVVRDPSPFDFSLQQPIPQRTPQAAASKQKRTILYTPPSLIPPPPPSTTTKPFLADWIRSRDQQDGDAFKQLSYDSDVLARKRAQRFHPSPEPLSTTPISFTPVPPSPSGPVVGTSQELEKPYLRLTEAPDPAKVRPLMVLKRSLKHVMDKFKASPSNYAYISDQLQSIRQDLTVQHIRDEFAVQVYETHARIALEVGQDFGEFNKCQSQLMQLYATPGCAHCGTNSAEFAAYRLLYNVLIGQTDSLAVAISEAATSKRSRPAVAHALSIRRAVNLGNHLLFFKLARRASVTIGRSSGSLINALTRKVRDSSLKSMASAYRPTLPLEWISNQLCFQDIEACRQWLQHEYEIVLPRTATEMDMKSNSMTILSHPFSLIIKS